MNGKGLTWNSEDYQQRAQEPEYIQVVVLTICVHFAKEHR